VGSIFRHDKSAALAESGEEKMRAQQMASLMNGCVSICQSSRADLAFTYSTSNAHDGADEESAPLQPVERVQRPAFVQAGVGGSANFRGEFFPGNTFSSSSSSAGVM